MLQLQIHGQLITNQQLIIKLYISVFFAIQNRNKRTYNFVYKYVF